MIQLHLNKSMDFLKNVASSRFPLTNNQLITSFNLRNYATIQDGKVTVQQVQGRQGQSYACIGYKGGQARVVKCYNCQGEGHMVRQCTQPKHPRNAAWFKEKAMLAEALESEKKIKELDNIVYKVGQSTQTVHMLTKPQVFYDNTHKQALGYQNPFYLKKALRIKPILYDGSVISSQHAASPVIDDDETLILEEELLVYVRDTYPNAFKPSGKLVAVTPLNKVKIVSVVSLVLVADAPRAVDIPNSPSSTSINQDAPSSTNQQQQSTIISQACALGKSKKSSHQSKAEDTNQEKLYLLHMDLYDPMRVESINAKKYILVMVDDYSQFTWVKFLRSKDEAPSAIIKCIKNIQIRLNAIVCDIRTDNGTEFVNQTLRKFYENIGISHQTSVARTP
nr:ribonuclease H-like domain-containing protein [Tanacetum cinerariifolium]